MKAKLAVGLMLSAWGAAAGAQSAPKENVVKPDERLRSVLNSGDARVLSVEELEGKEGEPRRARVIVESPKRGTAVHATIDVASGAVVESRPLAPNALPFTTEQLERATAIALRDVSVRRLLGPNADSFRARTPGSQMPPFAVEGFLVASEDPADRCATSRCVDLLFVANGRYLAGNRVTVELGADRVTVSEMGQHQGDHR